jgi:hypothetical protein
MKKKINIEYEIIFTEEYCGHTLQSGTDLKRCPYESFNAMNGTYICNIFHRQLLWVTLDRVELKRCKECMEKTNENNN